MASAVSGGDGKILVLDGDEIDRLLDRRALRDGLRQAFVSLAEGTTDAPPRIAARTPAGLLAAMPGYVEGVGLAAKLVSVFPENRELGLPSHLGLIALFDPDRGMPLAVMDAERITELRTSVAAALAADLLAPERSRILTILGAGAQARGHLEAFVDIRPWREIRLVNRTPQRAEELAAAHPGVAVFDDLNAALGGADVIACCTDARRAVLPDDLDGSGVHVSSVGMGAEVPPRLIDAAAVVAVEWRGAVTQPPPAGARELQGRDPSSVTELGAILTGAAPGRTGDDELTVYKSTGHAVEDVVAARLVYDAALSEGVGSRVTR